MQEFYRTNQNAAESLKSFATIIWRFFPALNLDLKQPVIVIENDSQILLHKIFWIDLYTLNPNPSSGIFSAINTHYGESGKGWLSKHVIDAYIFAIVDASNLKRKDITFGTIDCDMSNVVLKKQNIRNKAFFTRNITQSKNNLRNHLFFPLLVNRHFTLLWYCKQTHTLTYIDSIERNRSIKTVSQIQKSFATFIASFENDKEPKFEEKCLVKQLDSSSCGVCVCMSVELLCASITDNIRINEPIEQHSHLSYRHWIVYNLFAKSTRYSSLLDNVEKVSFQNVTVGLPNVGNSCWFNVVIQAVTAMIKLVSENTLDDNLALIQHKYAELWAIVTNLLAQQSTEVETLRSTLKKICKANHFIFGQQADPEEFLIQADLPGLLQLHHITCSFQINTINYCGCCKTNTDSSFTHHSDIILPLLPESKNEYSLQHHLNNYMKRNEKKTCSVCKATCDHLISMNFNSFPDVLIICLSRVCYDLDYSKLQNSVLISKTILVKRNEDNYLNEYELVSVIVHLGTNCANGHYVCYNFNDTLNVNVLDDSNSYQQQFSDAKEIIEKNGYLFFYRLRKVKYNDASSSDSDLALTPNNKKLIKRRKRFSRDNFDSKTVTEYQKKEFLPLYFQSQSSLASWKELYQHHLNYVVENILQVIRTPLVEEKATPQNYRHFMFLKNKIRQLSNLSNRINYDAIGFGPEFVMDILSYVRKKLCHRLHRVTLSDGMVIAHAKTVILVFKDSLLNQNCALIKHLGTDDFDGCNLYLDLVVDKEAIIYFTMFEQKIDYKTASHRLKTIA